MAVRASTASENQINQLIKCALDCARAWGRCASPLLSSVMFVPLRAGYDIANQGVKSYQAAEIGGRASSDRAVGVDHDSAAAKNFEPQRCQGPTRFLRRAPFLDDRVDAFDHQDGDAAEEAKPNIAKPSQMSLIKIKRC